MQLNQAAPGGGNNANEVEATMGCVVQLLAMTNMMRDNLLAFAAAPGDWPLARVDVSATVEQALKEAQPLLRSSKVKLQADVAEGLHGLADKARCAHCVVCITKHVCFLFLGLYCSSTTMRALLTTAY